MASDVDYRKLCDLCDLNNLRVNLNIIQHAKVTKNRVVERPLYGIEIVNPDNNTVILRAKMTSPDSSIERMATKLLIELENRGFIHGEPEGA